MGKPGYKIKPEDLLFSPDIHRDEILNLDHRSRQLTGYNPFSNPSELTSLVFGGT